jgi:hypothetical protein
MAKNMSAPRKESSTSDAEDANQTDHHGTRPKRVSITFKICPGWKGTKSRDFPGRTFYQKERNILQSWAKEFRSGQTVYLEQPDNRSVQSAATTGRTRKPYYGSYHITRSHAFHWFRDTQDRLTKKYLSEKLSKEEQKELKQRRYMYKISNILPKVYTVDRSKKNMFVEVWFDQHSVLTKEEITEMHRNNHLLEGGDDNNNDLVGVVRHSSFDENLLGIICKLAHTLLHICMLLFHCLFHSLTFILLCTYFIMIIYS